MAWMDNTGLYRKYGTEKAQPNKGGEYRTDGPQRMIEVKLTLTDLAATPSIVSDTIFFPKSRIEKVEIVNETAATSDGSAVLNIGLIRTDRSTEIDYDGIVAAAALSTFNSAGETVTITAGGTAAGALVGTTTTNVGYLTADYDTAAFTAGVIRVRIYFAKY